MKHLLLGGLFWVFFNAFISCNFWSIIYYVGLFPTLLPFPLPPFLEGCDAVLPTLLTCRFQNPSNHPVVSIFTQEGEN